MIDGKIHVNLRKVGQPVGVKGRGKNLTRHLSANLLLNEKKIILSWRYALFFLKRIESMGLFYNNH